MRIGRWVALLAMATAACDAGTTPPGAGRTRVLLTDAPFPYDQVQAVNVHVVSIDGTSNFDSTQTVSWTSLATPDRAFNLLDLQDGSTALLGEAPVAAASFEAIRLTIRTDLSGIVLSDGSAADVDWLGPATQTIVARVEQPLSAGQGDADLIIDFDVGRSFLALPGGGFQFLPWVRAVNSAATGTVQGMVRGPGGGAPVAGASLTLYRTFGGSRQLAATGRSGADGSYTIRYVSGGGPYAVEATPPTGVAGSTGSTGDLFVTPGETTTADVVLGTGAVGGDPVRLAISGPRQVAVGKTIALFAAVFNAAGDSAINVPVTWANSNPAVVQMTGGGASVTLTGLAAGATSITATLDALSDSITVTVGDPNAPVASVEVTPAAVTVAVGDSTGVQAVVKDAIGNVLIGRPVTWTVDPAALSVLFQNGNLVIFRALQAGVSQVSATVEGKTGTATVTVN